MQITAEAALAAVRSHLTPEQSEVLDAIFDEFSLVPVSASRE